MTGMKQWLLGIALVCGALPAAAQAQGPWCYPFGFVDGYGQGRVTADNNIPYFAAHPPVYYSYEIIRRPMGPSPFAYPGYMLPMQAEVEVVAEAPEKPVAVMVHNETIARRGDDSLHRVSYSQPLSRDQAARGSQMIINPFVKR